MDFLRRTWEWLWPPRVSFVELDELQARLLRYLLWICLVVILTLMLRAWQIPGMPWQPLFILLPVVTLCIVLQTRSRKIRQRLLMLMLLTGTVAVYWAALIWGTATAPGLPYLAIFGVVTTLLDGPRSGNWVTLACIATLFALRHHFGLPDENAVHLWNNVLWCTVFGQLVGMSFYHVFGRVQGQLNDQAERLKHAEQDRVALTRALMQGLRPRLEKLETAVAASGAALSSIGRAAEGLRHELGLAAELRHSLSQIDDQQRVHSDLRLLRHRFMLFMLVLAILTLWTAAYRNNAQGRGEVLIPALVGTALGGLLFWVQRRPVNVLLMNRGLLTLYLSLFVHGIWVQGLHGVPPSLPYIPNLILAASLLSGSGFAYIVAGLGVSLVAAAWHFGQPSFVEKVMLQNLAIAIGMLTIICVRVWQLHHSLLSRLEERALELAASMRQRRRLLGTIFHDISNPLMVIEGLAQLEAAGVPAEAQDRQRLEHMVLRIRQIIDQAETFLLGDASVPVTELKAVRISQLFADTQELFEGRLKAKRQHLTFESPAGLGVLGLEEVIRDSILSNLVSNALKFSQAAAGLALEAKEQGNEVALIVRDSGPGIPQAVIEAVTRRQAVISSTGTGGEQGQGLGLSLVQEHLHRLGGRLDLLRLPGGGTEARAWLKKAPPGQS